MNVTYVTKNRESVLQQFVSHPLRQISNFDSGTNRCKSNFQWSVLSHETVQFSFRTLSVGTVVLHKQKEVNKTHPFKRKEKSQNYNLLIELTNLTKANIFSAFTKHSFSSPYFLNISLTSSSVTSAKLPTYNRHRDENFCSELSFCGSSYVLPDIVSSFSFILSYNMENIQVELIPSCTSIELQTLYK